MKITPHGRLRYEVESETHPGKHGPYTVELQWYSGIGKCDCCRFRCYLEPKIRDGEKGEHLRCKHINAARELLGQELVDALIRIENEPAKHQRHD